MVKGMLIKLRARMGAAKLNKAKRGKIKRIKDEEQKLEVMEERLEYVADKVGEEIDRIERLKSSTIREHEFSWIKGKVTSLLIQDFVGAFFGAIFFAFTQEVWDITRKISMFSIMVILILSILFGFSLIYLSRRRRVVSLRVYHTALLRGLEIYIISFFTALLIISLLGILEYEPLLLFKGSVLIALPAVISAATADLLFY